MESLRDPACGDDWPTAGMVGVVHGVDRHVIKMAVAMQPTQASFG